MDLAGRGSSAFTGAVTFANDGRAIGMYRDAHSGDIDGEEGAAVFAREHAAGFKGLSAPAIEAEDPVGFRDRVPAFDVVRARGRWIRGCERDGDRDCVAAPVPVLLRSPSPCPHA